MFKFWIVTPLFLAVLILPASAAAVAPQCESLQKEIDTAIKESQSCIEDAECSSQFLGCPFGCETPINTAKLSELRTRISEYYRQCPECEYKCAVHKSPAVCDNGICKYRDK